MKFEKVRQLMDDSMIQHAVPCSDIAVTHKGKLVYRYGNGTTDDARQVPLKGEELYFLYSASKVITCTAVMQLVEQGKLGTEDLLEDYIPSYKEMWVKTEHGLQKAEQKIRISHLLTMTAGLNYDLKSDSITGVLRQNPQATTMELAEAFAKEPLEFEPGSHYRYSLCHDVLAAVTEKVSGMSYGAYLQKHIFDVCEMEHTGFRLNEETRARIASQYAYDEGSHTARLIEKKNEFILSPVYESGGAGLISCVEDYSRFVTVMANTDRLLKKETIDRMRKNKLSGEAYREFQQGKPDCGYGYGVRTGDQREGITKGEFGWDGAAGAYALIDPDHQVAIFYATHIRNHAAYLYQSLHPQIRDAVYEALFK